MSENEALDGRFDAATARTECDPKLLTPRQLDILQHALGLDEYGQGKMYRNHFCAGEDDEVTCRELVALGYMETFTRSYLPYYNCTVTAEGKAAMRGGTAANRLVNGCDECANLPMAGIRWNRFRIAPSKW